MEWIDAALADLERAGRLRTPRALTPLDAVRALHGTREVTVFCSNDYLGLREHPSLAAAVRDALAAYGTGVGASRLISGHTHLHEQAEQSLADLVGLPAALLASSGYALNVGALAALMGPDDLVFSDALNHASLIDGIRLSRARTVIVPHNDLAALETLLRDAPPARRRWMVTESLFSMDGDLPDLVALREVTARYGVALYVDEAHAVGVIGDGGGLCRHLGVVPECLVGTLGKALGASGAFIAGSPSLKSFLWNRCRAFVFSTGLAPPPSPLSNSRRARSVKTRKLSPPSAPTSPASAPGSASAPSPTAGATSRPSSRSASTTTVA
ncbi:MAG: aminotransferase class I/II-fold pyridoxal phosphate-dependent enzyme [Polyangiales bacterium]